MYADKHPEPTDPRVGTALVYLIVGLPGAGKTTHAKELETSASALRLTPDEWQIALFGDQNPPGKRDLEQRGRVTNRFATTPDQTFHMSDVELEQWRAQFQAPDDEELRGFQIPPVPAGHATWSQWASQRWPSLLDRYAPTAGDSRYSHEP